MIIRIILDSAGAAAAIAALAGLWHYATYRATSRRITHFGVLAPGKRHRLPLAWVSRPGDPVAEPSPAPAPPHPAAQQAQARARAR
jgi:hypothetical protein